MQQVQCDNVHHSYDGVRDAVQGFNLTIKRGEVLALIGPNGAGKSTTLRILATLQCPDKGRVLWDGRDAWPARYEIRQRIGFLGDGNALYPGMTAAGYLQFFAECYGQSDSAAKARVSELLQIFDLSSKSEARVSEMSKGMRQRLSIARTLVHRPELLLLDEPADGLDPRGRSDLRAILARTRERGVTVLISSHILRELDDLCDQTVILQQGKLVVAGEVADIIERYEVRRFVYQLRLLAGGPAARELLARRRVLVEAEGVEDGCETLSIQVQGGEELMADILAELCAAGVRVVTVSRVRSRLEDVYNRISDDRVA